MSIVFKPKGKGGQRELDDNLVKTVSRPNEISALNMSPQMLDENALLIKVVTEYQNKGKINECMKYQDILTRNLLYLARVSGFQPDESFNPFATEDKRHKHDSKETSSTGS